MCYHNNYDMYKYDSIPEELPPFSTLQDFKELSVIIDSPSMIFNQ